MTTDGNYYLWDGTLMRWGGGFEIWSKTDHIFKEFEDLGNYLWTRTQGYPFGPYGSDSWHKISDEEAEKYKI